MTRKAVRFATLVTIGLVFGLWAATATVGHSQSPPATLAAPVAARAGLERDPVSFRDVAKKVLPAVVSIEVPVDRRRAVQVGQPGQPGQPNEEEGLIPEPLRRGIPPFDDERIQRFFEEFEGRRGRMPLPMEEKFGSGVIVDPKGIVVTNFHVIEGAEEVQIKLRDGRIFKSRRIDTDRLSDLAIIRLDVKEPLPALEFGDSDAIEIGDRVLAVGAPYRMAGSVTHGIISGKDRNAEVNMYEDYLQTDAAINPGNSGGPLVDLAGRIVGINTVIRSQSGGFQGIALAIPSNMAKNVVAQLSAAGKVRRGYLGVILGPIDPEMSERLKLDGKSGVFAREILPDSPAAKAGLELGDVIVSLGGVGINEIRNLQGLVARSPIGQTLDLIVRRNGEKKTLQVVVGEQPSEFGQPTPVLRRVPAPNRNRGGEVGLAITALGIEVADVNLTLAGQFGLPEDAAGAVIVAVDRGSKAAIAGLRRGMIITQVDQKNIQNAKATVEAVNQADLKEGVLLQVKRGENGRLTSTQYLLIKSD